MHGAALAWSLLMPPGAALLELWPQPGMWRLYEHTAEWAGLSYRFESAYPTQLADSIACCVTHVHCQAHVAEEDMAFQACANQHHVGCCSTECKADFSLSSSPPWPGA